MKLIILAFILSISLHILIFSPIKEKKKEIEQAPSTSKHVNKSAVRYVRLQRSLAQKQNITKKAIPEVKKTTVKPTPKIYKKVEKKKIIPQKKTIVKKPKKIIPKPVKKVIVKPTYTKELPKKIIKPQKKRQTVNKKSLENFLISEPVPLDVDMLDVITQKYIKLYGEEYNSFTKVQKVYLQKNLKNIGRITQKYLRYPAIAVRTGQQGMNIIQFVLYPNGDISDLTLSNSSGYQSLDKNTIETIEIAYKDYPRPKTKTKIKIYVYYKLY